MIRNDNIVAIATPPGAGGIGIVRLSGSESHRLALRLFHPNGKKPRPRAATLGRIIDPGNNKVLDRCLLTLYSAPNSYTGEDAAEFSCHGSGPVLRRLLQLLVAEGARPAAAGEFTLRALLNGRIDLTQAEAINRLVRSRTLLQAEEAVSQLEGAVSERVNEIDAALLDVIARMEAVVDFADEDEEYIERDEAEGLLKKLSGDLKELVASFGKADLLRDGAVVVIAGGSNVGKSTLFNAILQRERSIVDYRPGTTRDYIAETIDLDGLPLTLVDTAGLRSGGDEVEIEGMRRTEAQLGKADAVVLVAEHGRALTDDECSILNRLESRGIPTLLLLNKADLGREAKAEKGFPISALRGNGVAGAIARLKEVVGADCSPAGGELITELRQQQLFRRTAVAVSGALELLSGGSYNELVLEELNRAMWLLGEITGEKSADDVLERIFSQFCIGK